MLYNGHHMTHKFNNEHVEAHWPDSVFFWIHMPDQFAYLRTNLASLLCQLILYNQKLRWHWSLTAYNSINFKRASFDSVLCLLLKISSFWLLPSYFQFITSLTHLHAKICYLCYLLIGCYMYIGQYFFHDSLVVVDLKLIKWLNVNA